MVEPVPDIVVAAERIALAQLAELVDRFFSDMVKYVVDVGDRNLLFHTTARTTHSGPESSSRTSV